MDLSAFVNERLKIDGVTFNIEDNQFNDYDRYAYHFTLSMVGELDAKDPDIGDRLRLDPQTVRPANAPNRDTPVRKFIIAESGVTAGLNLTSVEIEDSVSSNMRYKNTVNTGINITITEAYSINLIDQMFLASQTLGVRNWRLAPLFLELEFKAYKEDGTIVPFSEFNVRKVWKIILIDMESSLTQAGTVYRIKAAGSSTTGYLDYYYCIPVSQKIELGAAAGNPVAPAPSFPTPGGAAVAPAAQINPGNLTIAAFFYQLGAQLTDYYFNQRVAGPANRANIPFVIYNFEFCEEIGTLLVNTDAYTNGRRISFASFNQNDRTLTVSKGISITSLIDDLISSINIPDQTRPWFLVDDRTNLIKIPRVECVVRNVGYDTLNNDYVRELTYVISCKQSSRPTLSREIGRSLQQDDRHVDRQKDRLKFIAANSLKKAYPYYYTGRNTEIINCNIVFQNMHIIPLPLISTTQTAVNDSPRLAQLRTDIANIELRLAQRRREVADFQSRGLGPVALAIAVGPAQAEIRTLEAQLRPLLDEQTRLLDRQSQLAIFDPSVAARLAYIPGVSTLVSNPASVALRDQLLAADQRNRTVLGQLRLREFVEDQSFQNSPATYTYVADPRDIANTMGRTQVSEPQDRARQFYTTILSQIYDRSMNQLTEIEMEIKGDPYWLGKTNIERDQELLKYLNEPRRSASRQYLGSDTVARTVNYYNYDAHFLLIFRGGQAPDPETGLPDLGQSPYFTGLYQTITVTHKFENGVFTQKLNAVRDALLNLAELRGQRLAPSAPPPTPPPPPPPAPAPSPAPPPATPPTPPVTPPAPGILDRLRRFFGFGNP